MTRLKRTLRTADGLAMMVGIIVGSGIFRTPAIVARQLGRPILTFVAWVLGGALAFLGTLVFAELAARLALAGLVVVAFATGSGTGPSTVLPPAPRGVDVWGALAVAFRSVIWTYYGYADAAKIAEEVVDPGRTLPRIFLGGIATVIALYLLLNAAFLHVLPIERIAASNLVAGDVAQAIFGAKSGIVMAALAL